MNLYRIHLKTEANPRQQLIDYCLGSATPCLAIGWSYLHENHPKLKTVEDLSKAFRSENGGKSKRPIDTFARVEKGDLIWTRDLNGVYYIGRAIKKPVAKYDKELDIGACVSVDLKKVGTNVPGNIVSRFCRSGNSPTIERIIDETCVLYSKRLYNNLAGKIVYPIDNDRPYDLFEILPPLDLEELVIDYLQIKHDYYLSKNSVAKLDSTIKIECELFPRKNDGRPPAVLQVKGGTARVSSSEFKSYVEDGKHVFLFFSSQQYDPICKGVSCITRKELTDFVEEYYDLLPPAIKQWVEICS